MWPRCGVSLAALAACLIALCACGKADDTASPVELVTSLTRALGHMDIKEKLARALRGPAMFLYDRIRPILKLLGVAYVGYQAYDYVIPSFYGSSDEQDLPEAQRTGPSIQEAIGELGISVLAEGVSSWAGVPPDSQEILSRWQQQCRSRAACELGKSMALKMPYLSKIIGYFGSRLPLIHNFADALMQGTGLPDCSVLYSDCPYLRPTADAGV